jgi:hypothetical protein
VTLLTAGVGAAGNAARRSGAAAKLLESMQDFGSMASRTLGNESGSTPIFGDIAKKVLGRVDDVASKGAIGFAEGTAEIALTGMRGGGGHAIRHLEGNLIPNTGSLQSRVDAFNKIATPILENPTHVADWRIGGTQGRAFLGEVNGQNLAIVVAKEGLHQGKVISSFIPDTNQLKLLLSR